MTRQQFSISLPDFAQRQLRALADTLGATSGEIVVLALDRLAQTYGLANSLEGTVSSNANTPYQWVILKVAANLPSAAEGGFSRVELCNAILADNISEGLDLFGGGDRFYEEVRRTVADLIELGRIVKVDDRRDRIALVGQDT